MTVRAKLSEIRKREGQNGYKSETLLFSAHVLTAKEGQNPNPNSEWATLWPSAEIQITISKPDQQGKHELGGIYDFTILEAK